MNKVIFRVYIFIQACAKFYCFEYVWYVNNKCEIVMGLVLLFYNLSRKGVPWKFWLDSRFPWDPKLKWILKWLSLDRDYFKFYFLQKEKVY